MSGTITTLQTFPTFDLTLSQSPAQGMAFKNPSDGNIYLAILNSTFLALDKTTGAVVFANNASNIQFKTNWNPGADNFLNSAAGGFPNPTSVSSFDGAGNFISTLGTGLNCYGAIIAAGNYFAGDTGDNFVTVLDAATGAAVAQIDTTVTGPTTGVGQFVFEPTTGHIFCTAINAFLIEIDPVGLTLVNVYDLSLQGVGKIRGITPKGGLLYLTDQLTGQQWQVDPATGNLLGPGVFVGFSGPLIYDGTYFWILDPFSNAVVVIDSSGVVQAALSPAGSVQDIAIDPSDPPQTVWVTSGSSPADSVVRQLLFTPTPPPSPSTGTFHGTFVGFRSPSGSIGGTK